MKNKLGSPLVNRLLIAALAVAAPAQALGADFSVYSVYKGLDLGNPGEVPQKDFYVNMGSANGVRNGSILQVIRKVATYDVTSQKLYKDVSFQIATLKVIHTEGNAAIARLEKVLDAEITPATTPRAVMVGDLVKLGD